MQIQMYLNSLEIWSQKHGGGRHIKNITADDLKITLFLNQVKVLSSVYRGLLNQFQDVLLRKLCTLPPGVRSEPSIIQMTVCTLKPITSFTTSVLTG